MLATNFGFTYLQYNEKGSDAGYQLCIYPSTIQREGEWCWLPTLDLPIYNTTRRNVMLAINVAITYWKRCDIDFKLWIYLSEGVWYWLQTLDLSFWMSVILISNFLFSFLKECYNDFQLKIYLSEWIWYWLPTLDLPYRKMWYWIAFDDFRLDVHGWSPFAAVNMKRPHTIHSS